MLLQETVHPLAETAARFVWWLPTLPLIGFVINGLLSLQAATKLGPADPSADADHAHAGHGAHAHDAHDAHAHDAHAHDAHDAHPPRHRYAAITSIIGPGVLIASFVLALAMFFAMRGVEADAPFVSRLFSWMPVGDFKLDAALQLDALSMVMVLVITGIGSLIHVFSVGYMQDDPGYPRYFAYLNLFVFFMLLLVLGANYVVTFVGWEGVGLCSYLLIGFWFSEQANADAGKKAFVVNRIGDFGFMVAMFLLFAHLGTLDYTAIAANAGTLEPGGAVVTAICLFLFIGCTGKSAQIPLFTWLPDAMAGPTPVSALIHAATMVTAGVFLIARSSVLFSLAPVASLTVALVGGLTAIFAASIGLKQWDIKKVLAYSTVSQLGYMFIGVGVGAYTAGVFHLVTHAFFKALLFLGSGSVIFAMHRAYHATHNHGDDAQDMRNMGGLKAMMPVTWTLLWIATLAIAGVPPFSGFFSKDEILSAAYSRAHESTLADASLLGMSGSTVLYLVWILGLASALITAIYMTRMMLYTFHGPNRTDEKSRPHLAEAPWVMTGPLVVLGVLSLFGGWLNLPEVITHMVPLGPAETLEHWLEPVVGEATARVSGGAAHVAVSTEQMLIAGAIVIAIAGIAIAKARLKPEALLTKDASEPSRGFERILERKWYVDEIYDALVVRPIHALSRSVLWKGVDVGLIDTLGANGSAAVTRFAGWIGSQLQTGRVGTYAWLLVIGAVVVLRAFTAGN
ncbi:MAG: NADH-quinone oxidoreductase subunit L [Gemmatimonadetes bacterium]|nr:NADH-quinone oxidoreductase subunit L [Gemmatimonadota bacterium]